ncbi:MAG: bifunctional phosphoribosyl-AMP cyclohydrolase/phosphoribosyl-ATP diphosphatase HisIE [Terriglobia bacterium]
MSDSGNDKIISRLKFDSQGLIPAIVQDVATGKVLTLAYMNREAVELSLSRGETYFWSRSRGKLWHKGETSGNTQKIVRIDLDCDGDSLVIFVQPRGPACHTGDVSCFHEELFSAAPESRAVPRKDSARPDAVAIIDRLLQVIRERKEEMPEGSYTTYLFRQGIDKILKKIGEESAETIIAAKNKSPVELTVESADLLYHLLVLFVNEGLDVNDVWTELEKRSQKRKNPPSAS